MLPTDGDPSAQGARRRSVASRPRDGAEAEGFRSRMQSTQVADDALQTASRSYRKFVAVLPPSSSRSGGSPGRRSSTQQTTGLHRTMAKVCKSDGEGTFAGTHGSGEGAPIAVISATGDRTARSGLDSADRRDSKQRMVGWREYNPVAQGSALGPPPGRLSGSSAKQPEEEPQEPRRDGISWQHCLRHSWPSPLQCSLQNLLNDLPSPRDGNGRGDVRATLARKCKHR
jgi:hypothetical protein